MRRAIATSLTRNPRYVAHFVPPVKGYLPSKPETLARAQLAALVPVTALFLGCGGLDESSDCGAWLDASTEERADVVEDVAPDKAPKVIEAGVTAVCDGSAQGFISEGDADTDEVGELIELFEQGYVPASP